MAPSPPPEDPHDRQTSLANERPAKVPSVHFGEEQWVLALYSAPRSSLTLDFAGGRVSRRCPQTRRPES